MEQINKIELQGMVGNVRRQEVGGTEVMRFSLKTDHVIKSKGEPRVETEWHSCIAWKSKDNDLDRIEKGKPAHITGRMHYQYYVNSDGLDKFSPEVWVTRIHKTED